MRYNKTAAITHAGRAFTTSLYNRDPRSCTRRNHASKSLDFSALADAMAKGWGENLPLDGNRV